MKKLFTIFITISILFFVFWEALASENKLNLETKIKIEKIIEKYISKVEKKYNTNEQLENYERLNHKIITIREWISWEKLLIINYVWELIKSEIKYILKEKLLNYKDYTDNEIREAILELNKLEEPNIYWETSIDPDGSYHTYIESIYLITWLTIYQYDGIVTNVEKY